jgi:UDP-N-acetylglucosamine 3-dehydrogenase
MTVARGILVGLGRMGSYHLRVLRSLAGAEVAAIVDPSRERREMAPDGIPVFADLGDALAATPAEFACVATPAAALVESSRLALEAGLSVLVEKPMATSEEDAVALVAEAERRQAVLAVGLVERCNPAVEALRALLSEEQAGRIYQAHARRLSPYPGRESPVGVALDLATHDFDVIRFVTGNEIDRVYAETAARTGTGDGDLVSATLRLEGGTTGIVEVNWLTPIKVRQLAVTCERGMFVVDYITQDLTFHQHPQVDIEWDILRMVRGTGEGDTLRYGIARREPLVVQWERFLAALRGGGEPAARGADGRAALSIARAIEDSGRSHAPIRPAYRETMTR